MKIEHQILINQYGQGIVGVEQLVSNFNAIDQDLKKAFLNDFFSYFVIQSKPKEGDIEPAINASKLKPTYTPCVLLRKGIEKHKLEKIIKLPDNESEKAFMLLLNLFKIAYNRRFEQEKNDPDKWWYWDLSDNEKISAILSEFK